MQIRYAGIVGRAVAADAQRPSPGRLEGLSEPSVTAYDRSMTDRQTRTIEFRLDLTDDELAELERVLLKARATELGEVRRRQIRLAAGYGDSTTREVLDDEADRAQLRHDAVSRLLEALEGAR